MTTVFQRRIFMFIFIFLFLIIAPVIVFFAKGYRFDLKKGIFVYSGSVTIKGFPEEMDIYIDNKLADNKKLSFINSSYTINSLRPGEYNLKCKKDNYTIWEKNIEVHSGLSTEFWNILLFKNSNLNSEKLSDINLNQFFISPRDKNEIILLENKNNPDEIKKTSHETISDETKVSTQEKSKKNIYLLNTKKQETKEIFSTEDLNFLDPSLEENIEWSTDNNMLLIPFLNQQEKKEYIIAHIQSDEIKQSISLNEQFNHFFEKVEKDNNTQTTNSQKLNDKKNEDNAEDSEAKNIHQARWMFDKNNELVILTEDKKLYYYYLGRPEKTILIDENVNAFDFAGNRIYYSLSPHNIVWEVRNDNPETKRQITTKSLSKNNNDFIKMIVYDEYRIALIDQNKNLIIFNEEKEEGEIFEEIVQTDIQDIQFSDDGKKILFWSNNEIWFFMLRDWEVQPIRNKNDKFLITRFSSKINNVQWMDNYENIIFSVNNKIKSAEIDLRDKINITDILETQSDLNPRSVIYDKKNQTLYYINNETLNSLKIVEKNGILPI